jgi:UDP-glucose 4-epimerase
VSERRALITGASGFVGACLGRRLVADGWHTELLVRPGSDAWRIDGLRADSPIREVDLRDPGAVDRTIDQAAPEWIFHLAARGAYSWQTEPREIIETNVLGTLNLALACVRLGFSAFVHAGSSSEYGFKEHAPSEEEAPEPNSYYALSKNAATLLGRYVGSTRGLHMATLRLSSVYGPWEDPRRLIPTLIAHGLRGQLPPLVGPDIARDFVHAQDVCDAFIAVAEHPIPGSSRIYNVGTGRQTRLRDLVELTRARFDIATEPDWGSHAARSWDSKIWVSDPRKIEREVGWRAAWDLATGFGDTVSWLQARPALWPRYGLNPS